MEYKHDFSDRSHDQPADLKLSLFDRLWISAGGGEPETVIKNCSKKEISDFKALGLVLLGSSCLTAATATTPARAVRRAWNGVSSGLGRGRVTAC